MPETFSSGRNFGRYAQTGIGAVLCAALLGIPGAYVGLWALNISVFVLLPMAIGGAAAALYEGPRRRDVVFVGGLSAGAVVANALLLFLLGCEGAVCLVMACPLGVGAGLAGAAVARWARMRGWALRGARSYCVVAAALPLLAVMEEWAPVGERVRSVTTTIEVDATPEEVWPHVIAFRPLPEPEELLFRAGVAYPVGAAIDGAGVGAVRRCLFSTGSFVEPITDWDEPHRLAFSVTESAPPLREWSVHGEVDAPHLDGYLLARRGEFLLEPTAAGGTRLTGTTWYSHGLRPSAYWSLWSDWIIHRIHMRVLTHIRAEAEG